MHRLDHLGGGGDPERRRQLSGERRLQAVLRESGRAHRDRTRTETAQSGLDLPLPPGIAERIGSRFLQAGLGFGVILAEEASVSDKLAA